MPDTWTPVFDLTNKNRVDKWLSEGKKQLELVIDNIMSKRKGDFIERKIPRWVATIPAAYMYETERKTKNLLVNKDICIGCGICAKNVLSGQYKSKKDILSGNRKNAKCVWDVFTDARNLQSVMATGKRTV